MIFITDKEHKAPLFRGYVNKVFEKEYNGGKIRTYKIGTSEKKQDGTKVYSSWFCGVMGEAKKKEDQLKEGVPIDVYGFKMTNISKKNEDGTWGKAFFNVMISDFEVHQFEPRNNEEGNEESAF
jgi:hypothetical protein